MALRHAYEIDPARRRGVLRLFAPRRASRPGARSVIADMLPDRPRANMGAMIGAVERRLWSACA
jgi:hypothetical protein